MKSQKYGVSSKPHQGMHPTMGTYNMDCAPGEECRRRCGHCSAYGRARKVEALAAYKEARMNGNVSDDPKWEFPQDGTYTWEGKEYWGCAVRYTEGTRMPFGWKRKIEIILRVLQINKL